MTIQQHLFFIHFIYKMSARAAAAATIEHHFLSLIHEQYAIRKKLLEILFYAFSIPEFP